MIFYSSILLIESFQEWLNVWGRMVSNERHHKKMPNRSSLKAMKLFFPMHPPINLKCITCSSMHTWHVVQWTVPWVWLTSLPMSKQSWQRFPCYWVPIPIPGLIKAVASQTTSKKMRMTMDKYKKGLARSSPLRRAIVKRETVLARRNVMRKKRSE